MKDAGSVVGEVSAGIRSDDVSSSGGSGGEEKRMKR